MAQFYLGMISGTSVDGVDAAICALGDHSCRVVAARTFAYPPAISERIEALIESGAGTLAEIGAIDVAVGRFFADCALALIRDAGLKTSDIAAIGHHGQTIWHEPDPPEPFSWQIGDPNSIAAITGIETIADLRRLDMAVGGQGAPLAPGFHAWMFATGTETRIVVNIGGIANLTLLAPDRDVLGFDTGPGNTLLDYWVKRCRGLPFDDGGQWASTGQPDHALLAACLDDPYFALSPPKSTGREYFNAAWLTDKLAQMTTEVSDVNVAATLLELTAQSLVAAIRSVEPDAFDLIVCGGGAKNAALMQRIGALAGRDALTTAEFGLDPDYVEAALMAWLAHARLHGRPGNVPTVTAAREAVTLGALYSGDRSQN